MLFIRKSNSIIIKISIIIFACSSLFESLEAFDDDVDDGFHHHYNHDAATEVRQKGPLPKDKVLLKDVKTLVFHKNKRTTARRTQSIPQLSCVGGTARSKPLIPDVVECENIGYDGSKSKLNWKCHADISDRIAFTDVEVICEGYDYPEDDYILLGSCGLEFSLDYKDPHDYHDHSYFKHLDEHEKEMHRARVQATDKSKETKQAHGYWSFLEQVVKNFKNRLFLIGAFFSLALCTFIIVRFFSTGSEASRSSSTTRKQPKCTSYCPLTSAVLTTKKAC